MEHQVITLANKASGKIELDDAIFAVPVRGDILHRMVKWQRAKRRAGTHKTKGVSEIRGSTAKPWRQKGTGRARAGSRRSPQFRGGAVIFGPVVRSHAEDLPKKVRKLALKTALSSKREDGKLVVLEAAALKEPKTKALAGNLRALGWSSVLIIDGPEIDINHVIREHLLLALPMNIVCGDDCKGLCTQCGANRNATQCGCESEKIDPRWADLRKLQKED